jgi:hypothetical protein
MTGQLGLTSPTVMRWRVGSAFLNRSAASSSAHSITRTAQTVDRLCLDVVKYAVVPDQQRDDRPSATLGVATV